MVFNRSARVAETMRSLTSWSSWSRLGLTGMPLLAAGLLLIGVLLAGTAGEVRAQTTPTVTIAASTTGAVTEGTPAAFTLTRTGDTAAALTVNVSVSETGKMLSGAPPTTATFPAGSATATLTVPTDDDNVDEVIQGGTVDVNETQETSVVTATVAAGTGYSAGTPASASVTVTDNDVPATTFTLEFLNPAILMLSEDDPTLQSSRVRLTLNSGAGALPGG